MGKRAIILREVSVAHFFARDQLIRSALSFRVSRTFSQVGERLLCLLQREEISLKEIVDLLICDPGMATKIINIANSAYYSRGTRIESLNQAVLNIGLKEVKKILVCMVFINDLLGTSKLNKENLLFLWGHSLFVGCASRKLCERLLIDDPEKVFTAGLFHDIGKLVFFANIDWYMETIKEAVKEKLPLSQLEVQRFGIDHREIGCILANRWKFPDSFVSVIKDHDIMPWKNGNSRVDPLIEVVCAADTFYYYREVPSVSYSYILRNELKEIEEEVEKFTDIVSPKKDGE